MHMLDVFWIHHSQHVVFVQALAYLLQFGTVRLILFILTGSMAWNIGNYKCRLGYMLSKLLFECRRSVSGWKESGYHTVSTASQYLRFQGIDALNE